MPWQHYFYDEHCPSFTIRHLVFLAPIRGLHLGTPYTGDCVLGRLKPGGLEDSRTSVEVKEKSLDGLLTR